MRDTVFRRRYTETFSSDGGPDDEEEAVKRSYRDFKLSAKTAAPARPELGLAVLLIFTAGSWVSNIGMPTWAQKPLAMAGIVYLSMKLLTFRRWADEHRHVLRFCVCFLVMLLELSFENGMVWLVSAWDNNKYSNQPGLQDNVELALLWAGQRHPLLLRLAKAWWCNILHFLGAILALAFSVLWDQVPYSGFGIMSRVVLTVAGSRLLRIASFMVTVLPNPRPGCYQSRFPPVPPTLWLTIKAGYTHIRGFGGCNDLIFSGHGAFWVLAPLAFQTYYPQYRWVTALLWVAQLQASLRDVADKQHYSVDMLLAVIVTAAVWSWLGWVYDPRTQVLAKRKPGAAADRPNPFVLGLIGFCLLAAGIIVIGGKA